MPDQAIGFRVQQLGIELDGEQRLGFSGAYKTNQLWTDTVMIGACDRRDLDNKDDADWLSEFREIESGFRSSHPANYNAGLIRPDTVVKKMKEQPRTEPEARCRSHLYNQRCGSIDGVGCGVYAFKDMFDPQFVEQYNPDRFSHAHYNGYANVVTTVLGWGACAEYEVGWRFERAKVLGMTIFAGTKNPEEKFKLVEDDDHFRIGRFVRPGLGNDYQNVLGEIPIHNIMTMLSAKFQCAVEIEESYTALVSSRLFG